MSAQALKRILIGMGVVLGLYLIATFFGVGRTPTTDFSNTRIATILEGISESSLESVSFTSVTPEVHLQKENGEWHVNGAPADSATLAELWSYIDELSVMELASTNPANHGRFGLSEDAAATTILRSTGGRVDTLMLGNISRRLGAHFARLPSEDDVYLIGGQLRLSALRTFDGWRDRQMIRVDTATVNALQLENAGERYRLQRDSVGWTVASGPADSTAVARVLELLVDLKATAVLPDSTTVPGDPLRRIQVLDERGATLAGMSVYEGADSTVVKARVDGNEMIFQISALTAERMIPDRATIGGGS